MATYEIYVGGPASANFSRAMFPAPTFNANSAAMQSVTPSSHKGPVGYQLGRVLDAGKDKALGEFVRNTTIAQGDVLGTILVPKNCVFRGLMYHVASAATAVPGGGAVVTSITPSLRGVAGGTFPVIAAGTANARGFAKVGGTAWADASGAVADGDDFWIDEPTVLDLTLTALVAEGNLNTMRLVLIPVVEFYSTGEF